MSEQGRIYLVTFVTATRRRLFDEWHAATAAAKALHDTQGHDRLLCWVLMPDHWHGLIELDATKTLTESVRRIKGRTARAVNIAIGARGPVWSNGFHDHALRREEDLLATARYIIRNPVRAGLVARCGLYPFWDAVWLDGD